MEVTRAQDFLAVSVDYSDLTLDNLAPMRGGEECGDWRLRGRVEQGGPPVQGGTPGFDPGPRPRRGIPDSSCSRQRPSDVSFEPTEWLPRCQHPQPICASEAPPLRPPHVERTIACHFPLSERAQA
jgi:hypothetical protein